MSIDVYKKKEKTNRLFSITDDLYTILVEGLIIDKLEKKTGILIDDIGTCRLSFQHLNVLLNLINAALKDNLIHSNKLVIEFINFLNKAIKNETDLDFVGD